MADGQKKEITITTKRADGFRIVPAEGALGGITPAQMYQINFYIEAPNIPRNISHELTEEGKLGRQTGQEQDGGDIIRELQCAVLMTIPQAEALARWILSTVEQQRNTPHDSGYVM